MLKIVARNKQVNVVEGEAPEIKASHLLIQTKYSVISPGTELSILHQDQDHDIPLGYSAVGVVEDCGEGAEGFQKGDIIACYGAPYVSHSETLLVPKTLCAKVPASVEMKEAALAGIGAIAIHALRVANLQFGESVVIVGAGLLGQMIAKIAEAAAYDVIVYDMDQERVDMLKGEGMIKSFSNKEAMEKEVEESTNHQGADAVLLCAGGKRSPLTRECLKWVRNKGKTVIVGDVEPDFPRDLMFVKEAEILISRAGGPGRYDQVYEAEAIDYPYGFVRWTEGRNVAEFIRLVSEKRIDVRRFVESEVLLTDVQNAFEQLLNQPSSTLTKVINFSK